MYTIYAFYTAFTVVAHVAEEREALFYFNSVCEHSDCQSAVLTCEGRYVNSYTRGA